MFTTNSYVVWVILIILIGIVFVAKEWIGNAKEEGKLPYKKKQSLMTEAERNLFGVLTSTFQDSYLVFPQVNLDKFIYIEGGSEKYQSFYHRINQYSVDFLFCSKQSTAPVLAIELDDSSHAFPRRRERDEKVERFCADAGIPLLRIKNQRSYTPADIKSQVDAVLTGRESRF